MVKHYLH